MLEPAKSWTVIDGRSRGAVPAVPAITCERLVVELSLPGDVTLTCGGVVSIVNVTGGLLARGSGTPFPGIRSCSACAVYTPCSRGWDGPTLHAVFSDVVSSVWTSLSGMGTVPR